MSVVSVSTQRPVEATLFTSGVISAAVAWGVDDQGRVLVPPVTECRNQRYGYDYLSVLHFLLNIIRPFVTSQFVHDNNKILVRYSKHNSVV